MAEGAEKETRIEEAAEVLPSLAAAWRWLQGEGYKVARGKLYQDAKLGKIRLLPGGGVPMVEVEAYIVRGRLKKASAVDFAAADDLAAARYEAELDKIREQTRAIILDREIKEGKYVLREDAVMARVDQLTVLEANFRQVLHLSMLDWAYVLGGRPEKVPEALRAADADLDKMLNALARSEVFAIEYNDDYIPDGSEPAGERVDG